MHLRDPIYSKNNNGQKRNKIDNIKRKERDKHKCNTLGVCHSLSSGFELKRDRLSGDDDVKAHPTEMSLI
jgi:hypothetical protein